MSTEVRISFGDSLRSASDCLLIGVFDGEEDKSELLQSCNSCLLYTSPSPRDATLSRMPSSA